MKQDNSPRITVARREVRMIRWESKMLRIAREIVFMNGLVLTFSGDPDQFPKLDLVS